MTQESDDSPSTMSTLFLSELSAYVSALERWLPEIERDPGSADVVGTMADAAHSIKGAAKLLHVEPVVELAGGMESMLREAVSQGRSLNEQQVAALAHASRALRTVLAASDKGVTDAKLWKVEDIQKILEAHIELKNAALSNGTPSTPAFPIPSSTQQAQPQTDTRQSSLPEVASDIQLVSLFFVELENQTGTLTDGLLALEANANDFDAIDSLMRAAHSIKGAARVIGLQPLIHLAHALEDVLQRVSRHAISVGSNAIDIMFRAVDIFSQFVKSGAADLQACLKAQQDTISEVVASLQSLGSAQTAETPVAAVVEVPTVWQQPPGNALQEPISAVSPITSEGAQKRLSQAQQISRIAKKDRVVRVTADYLTRLMGLAGELLVESRWLQPFSDALLHLKKSQYELSATVDALRASVDEKLIGEDAIQHLLQLQHETHNVREDLARHIESLELFSRRHATLSDKLYRQVIASRMTPFGDGVESFPRLVRDLAKQLGKRASLEIIGRTTTIDRDIFDKLKAPLNHLLRNAVDHGIETPDERIALGKSPEGHIRLEARHRAGLLSIIVSDDGRGVDLARIREKVVEMNLVGGDMAKNLTDSELLDFLFLPGFTTSKEVTEISGRGVGLNIVQNMVHEVSGQVRVGGKKGQGAVFTLLLPLTLSVLRALMVQIGGEPYAFPLARVERAMVVPRSELKMVENREYFCFNGQNIGLIAATRILELPESTHGSQMLSIVVITDGVNLYGVVVDRILGEKELVVQELDPRLGRVSDIGCGAFMEDGSPILVVDIEDMVRSVDKLLSGGAIGHLSQAEESHEEERHKRILVVDDSITVREVECRILENQGYLVDVAVNGADGWNSVRIGEYDLVVTDVDMPRMNGIELVRAIRGDARLRHLPVMIVSYKERSDDRLLGMEAGANYYLAKSSFHDDRFLDAVRDLIGGADT